MSSIEMAAFRGEMTPYDVRRWATDEEIADFGSGDLHGDIILA
ncbi:MAG: hypothetical protein Q4B77_06430 [Coriobacteriaceae bacterium]|nr:hypothetical protein [Coriobacteriaceae bacterium]